MLPVLFSWAAGQDVEGFGLRAVVMLPVVGCALMFNALNHRQYTLRQAAKTLFRRDLEMMPLLPHGVVASDSGAATADAEKP